MKNFYTKYRETLIIALKSLGTHKTRSMLTMLGIIFGVGAVIAMLSIGEGARQESLEQIEVLGVRNIIIRSVIEDENQDEDDKTKVRPMGITLKDAEAIGLVCTFAERISPSRELKIDARTYDGHMKTMLIGANRDYADIFNIELTTGSFFLESHFAAQANVCVIGADVKQKLFGFTDPLYKMVKLEDKWFTVVGVISRRKESTVGGVDAPSANAVVFVPITTAMSKFPHEGSQEGSVSRRGNTSSYQAVPVINRTAIDQIAVQIDKNIAIAEASRVINRIIKQRHNGQEDFTVTIPEHLIEQSQKTQSIFNIVMGAIAGISLLVGGIGIMNIMLASVLERTREIGVRRAIGATKRMVVVQFLAEATMLSVFGGLLGIALGWGLTSAITAYAGWRTIISVFSIGLAFTVAAATGIVFGYYPARRAANADVIDALRYE